MLTELKFPELSIVVSPVFPKLFPMEFPVFPVVVLGLVGKAEVSEDRNETPLVPAKIEHMAPVLTLTLTVFAGRVVSA